MTFMKPKCGTRTLFRTDGLFYEPSHWLGAKSLQSKTCLSTTDHAKQRPSDDHTGRKRQVTHSRHWLSTLRDPFCRGSAPAATALSYLICMPLISPDTASRPLPSAIKTTTPPPTSVGRMANLLTHFKAEAPKGWMWHPHKTSRATHKLPTSDTHWSAYTARRQRLTGCEKRSQQVTAVHSSPQHRI